MTHVPKYNIYKTPDGVVTLASKGNTLVVQAGSPISKEQADRLNIPALEAERDAKRKPADPLADLKPAEVAAPADAEVAPAEGEEKPKPRSKGAKPDADAATTEVPQGDK